MADLRISQLTELTTLLSSDVFPVVNSNETKKVTLQSIKNAVLTGNISGNNLKASFNLGSATGNYSFAEGYLTTASGFYSHAEGNQTRALSAQSHAEGYNSEASGASSHAEGSSTKASGDNSHAEGTSTTASGAVSHAEGVVTTAFGYASHSAGFRATAAQDYTYAWSDGNLGTITQNISTTRTGQYMVSASGGMFIPGRVGIGTDSVDNALTVVGTISTSNHGSSNLWNQAYNVSTAYQNVSSLAIIQNGNSLGQNLLIGTNDNYNFTLETSGTPRVTVLNSGNVGIGTATPNQRLTVSGSISATNIIQSNQIAFSVDNNGATSPVAGTVTYNVTRLNRGNAMNASTGEFTAPVTGVYHFTFSGIVQETVSANYHEIQLRVNGNWSTASAGIRGWTYGNAYLPIGFAGTIDLNQGDIVTVFVSQNSGLHGNNASNFSGFLVG